MQTQTMTQEQAQMLRTAHNEYVKRLGHMTRAQLAAEYCGILSDRGAYSAYGGPQSKDELINACANERYPIARLNEAIHVLGHQSHGWSACNFCHDDDGTHNGHICQCDRHGETDCTTCGKQAQFHFSSTYLPAGRVRLTDHGKLGHPYTGSMSASA